ncbi:3-methyladenine DNA glycosylase [Microbacterium protaetiae]|uniref:3-methyladenine DNA glycosylase n=1 Tax=Microbacterium protaetiae TaxID=2509458 RepID=A0A4P6EMA6_9MICO|nr:3-methyladenine DNA glycosylase [Microbacterium protaetiae]QAY61377.1 3-methyladenine DNA glycosylase [Microbacterium protaetiae]
MTTLAPSAVLSGVEWRALEAAHRARADALTAGHRERAARGEKHPVEDFLFAYYSYKPAVLRTWHPGVGIQLEDAAERAHKRWYTQGTTPGSARVDAAAYRAAKAPLVDAVTRLLRATVDRPARFGCFGLHEWAMVYRQREHRHPVPLRLGQSETDAVVEDHDLRCTHFDAFRFFTSEAVPRNSAPLTRDGQAASEQPGCLHANMDLYKWAVKLGPLVPGELLLDAFELARDIRYLDMQASPYDMAAWAGEPVRIETAEGKAEYVRRQRAFAARANALRQRLLAATEH